MSNLTDNLKDILAATWDSLLGRVFLLGLAFGWVPFVLLSMAAAALKGN